MGGVCAGVDAFVVGWEEDSLVVVRRPEDAVGPSELCTTRRPIDQRFAIVFL